MQRLSWLSVGAVAGILAMILALAPLPIRAAEPPVGAVGMASSRAIATYADLATLADSAPQVLKLKIRMVAPVEAARAPDIRKGWVRLYIEAEPQGVVRGPQVLPPMMRYLLDAPLDAKGHPPPLKKQLVLVFAEPVVGPPGTLQLVAPDSQLPWSPELEARVAHLLAELAAPGAPPRVSGVREAMFVPGNLAGEGETQIFLATEGRTPAAITVVHERGKPTRWSVSFTEVVESSGAAPAADTLAWYRLACSLPDALPAQANVSEAPADRDAAVADYLLVRGQLGVCTRVRG